MVYIMVQANLGVKKHWLAVDVMKCRGGGAGKDKNMRSRSLAAMMHGTTPLDQRESRSSGLD